MTTLRNNLISENPPSVLIDGLDLASTLNKTVATKIAQRSIDSLDLAEKPPRASASRVTLIKQEETQKGLELIELMTATNCQKDEALIPKLTDTDTDLDQIQRDFAHIDTITGQGCKGQTLAALIPKLTNSNQIDRAFAIIDTLTDQDWKGLTLKALIPKLTDADLDQIQRSFARIDTITNQVRKGLTLEALIPKLTDLNQIDRAFALIDTFTDEDWKGETLKALISKLTDTDLDQIQRAFACIDTLTDEGCKGRTLVPLIPKLTDPNQINRAFALIETLSDRGCKGQTLTALIPKLTDPNQIDRAFALIDTLTDQLWKGITLKALILKLTDADLDQIQRSFALIDTLTDEGCKGRTLVPLIPKLTDVNQVNQALKMAQSLTNQRWKLEACNKLGLKQAEIAGRSTVAKICPLVWQKLEKRNGEKTKANPMVVVIVTDDPLDPVHNVLVPGIQYSLAEIAKTHYVAIQTLNDGKQFRAAIKSSVMQAPDNADLKRKADSLIVLGHGSEISIQFGKDSFYTWKDIKPSDYEDLKVDASIHLLSCLVGKSGFAGLMSLRSNRLVYAPKDGIYQDEVFFEPDGARFISGEHPGYVKDDITNPTCSMYRFKPAGGGEEFIGSLDHTPVDRHKKLDKWVMKL